MQYCFWLIFVFNVTLILIMHFQCFFFKFFFNFLPNCFRLFMIQDLEINCNLFENNLSSSSIKFQTRDALSFQWIPLFLPYYSLLQCRVHQNELKWLLFFCFYYFSSLAPQHRIKNKTVDHLNINVFCVFSSFLFHFQFFIFMFQLESSG